MRRQSAIVSPPKRDVTVGPVAENFATQIEPIDHTADIRRMRLAPRIRITSALRDLRPLRRKRPSDEHYFGPRSTGSTDSISRRGHRLADRPGISSGTGAFGGAGDGCRWLWVTEYLPQQKVLKSLAFWMNGEYVYDFEYRIENTPCERVVEEKRLVHIPDRVIELFPNDPDLCTLNAVSYAGVPLLRSDGSVWGASNVCRAVHLWVRLDFNGCSSRGSCAYSRTSAGGTGGDGKTRCNYRSCVREWFDYSSNRKWVLRLVRKTVY